MANNNWTSWNNNNWTSWNSNNNNNWTSWNSNNWTSWNSSNNNNNNWTSWNNNSWTSWDSNNNYNNWTSWNNNNWTSWNNSNNNTPCSCQSPTAVATNRSQCCRWYVFSPALEFLPPPLSPEMLALLTSLYALVVVGALLANGLVTVVVVKARMLRSFTNSFILSLVVSDLLVAGFNMPVRSVGVILFV